MKKLSTLFFSILSLLMSFSSMAQEANFSQYHYTPFLTNPAMISSDDYFQVFFNYRYQPLQVGQAYSTPMLSGVYPLLNAEKQQWGAVGLSIINDQATNFLSTTGVAGAFSYNLPTGKILSAQSFIAFGVELAYFIRVLNAEGLSTANQFTATGFDASLNSGESLENLSKGYFTSSLGANWFAKDAAGRQLFFFGLSARHLNQPDVSFYNSNDARLPLQFTATGGYRVLQTSRISIMPTFRWFNKNATDILRVGTWGRYHFREGDFLDIGTAGLGLWYDAQKTLVASIEVVQPNYIVAFSYDFSLGQDVQNWQGNGTPEITLAFRKQLGGYRPIRSKPLIDEDQDDDGIPDVEDNCPEVFGEPSAQGCPDKDLDSIPDIEDRCPENYGEKTLQGCPDIDLDKIPDFEDKCPEIYGESTTEGCPDKDLDSIPDAEDNCPEVFGYPELKGCPESELTEEEKIIISKAVHIQFESNKAIILPVSYAVLDEVVFILKQHPHTIITLKGHTDSNGSDEENQILSEDRAKAVKDYFAQAGINPERIFTEGYGESKPIDTNDTPEGRANNRRVEIEVVTPKK